MDKSKYNVQNANQKQRSEQNVQKQDKSKVRQTRFIDDIRNHDSDLQDKQDAIVGNVNVRINATRGESTEQDKSREQKYSMQNTN